jgi:hypothetical protein
MLFRSNKNSSNSTISQDVKGWVATFIVATLVNPAFAQITQGIIPESKANAVTCYKTSIKEPLTFYGNPMDTFTLYDGTRWKVSSGGAFDYIPVRYRNVLICPSEELLVIDKKVISVSRLNQ